MISVDYCDGKQTLRGLPPERIGEFVRRNRTGDDSAAMESNGLAAGVAAAVGAENGTTASSGRRPPVLWVDVSAPTDDDWRMLADQFGFHPLAVEDAQKQHQRAKVDAYDGYLYLSARAWAGARDPVADLDEATQELDIFIGPNYLVTIHNGHLPSVAETRARWERYPARYKNKPAFLLYLLLDAVVDEYFPAMDQLDADIEALEANIYQPKSGVTAATDEVDFGPVLLLKKRLLLVRQALAPLRDMLNQLLRPDMSTLIASSSLVYFQDVYDHTLRLIEEVDLHREILNGVTDALRAEAGNRLNQVVRTMTGISTILMSAALIAGIYGMNFKFMPELEWRYGYFYALASMIVVAAGLTVFFKRIRWF